MPITVPRRRWRRPAVLDQIAVFDFETDPFLRDRDPRPFCAAFYDGHNPPRIWWGPDCVSSFVAFLKTRAEPMLLYAHNGGKFDFLYMMEEIEKSPQTFFIKTRLVSWYLGIHELRDSFAILPAPLGKMGNKRDIDLARLEAPVRERHRFEIEAYARQDCTELYKLVRAFVAEFGARLTAPSAALNELKERHPFPRLTQASDGYLRQFYHGARVECFLPAGVYRNKWQVYDVNSMYPYAMANYEHPIGRYWHETDRYINKNTRFLTIECFSDGAFGVIGDDGNYHFPSRDGRWDTTIHEFRVARKWGLIKGKVKVLRALNCNLATSFKTFVDHFYDLRQNARQQGDQVYDVLYKLILNGAYGKTGIDPRRFRETCIVSAKAAMWTWPDSTEGWQLVERGPLALVFERPVNPEGHWSRFQNVGIAASITGAARAVMLETKAAAQAAGFEIAYCDTDSFICTGLPAELLHPSALGAWKLEAQGDELAIAGKKTFALRSDKRLKTGVYPDPHLVDWAAKGVPMTASGHFCEPGEEPAYWSDLMDVRFYQWDIISRVAKGETFKAVFNAPTIRRSGKMDYGHRTVKATTKGIRSTSGKSIENREVVLTSLENADFLDYEYPLDDETDV